MAAFKKGQTRSRFLPQGAVEAMWAFAVRFGGLLLLLLSGLLLVALLTADPHDPSFNTAVSGAANNRLGRVGAVAADLLWQVWGLSAVVLVLALLVWGMQMVVRGRSMRLWLLRLLLLPVLLLLCAITLHGLSLPTPPYILAGPGGALGRVLFLGLLNLSPDIQVWMVQTAGLVLSLGIGFFVLGFRFGVLTWLGRSSVSVVAAGGHAAASGLRRPSLRSDRPEDEAGERTEPSFAAPDPDGDERGEPRFFLPSSAPDMDGPAGSLPPDEEELDDDLEADEPPFALPTPAAGAPVPPPSAGRAVAEVRAPLPIPGKKDRGPRHGPLEPGPPLPVPSCCLPPLTLLTATPDQGQVRLGQDAMNRNAKALESVLEDFGVHGKVVKVRPGPVVTLYELEPAPGTKTSRVIGLADDIARSMSALSVRIATIPGRSVIGIELPNQRRETVYLRELLASDLFEKAAAKLTLVLGKDIGGAPVMVDLARMPHLLIAGTTGSGKSVAVNTMILSLLYRLTPDECRLIMIDPKMLELSVYDRIPHLLAPVVTEPGKAVVALKWAVREMEDRYRAMSQLGVRNIAGYNQRLAEARERGEQLTRTVQTGFDPETGKPVYEEQQLDLKALPFIVVIVDEMADLMLVAGKDIEAAVQRLAQMARAAGIHLIMATQRPSVDVITGTIKANFPTRISFQVTSKIDSRTILGEQGAEQLLGQGDMLYMAAGGRIIRVHGPFVSDQEVEKVVEHLRHQGAPDYIDAVTEEEQEEAAAVPGGNSGPGDEMYDQAVALVAREGKASTSFIQRHLQIGYNRAARLIERMEQDGVISRANHVGKREVLARSTRDEE